MNVLFCAHDAPNYINGPNIWLQRTLPELRKQGVASRVLFFPTRDPAACPTIQALRLQGISCEIYQGKKDTEFQVPWILRHIQQQSPDLFVPNLNLPGYHASRWIKAAGIPVVGVLHSDDPFYRALIEEFVRKPPSSPLSAIVCVSDLLSELVQRAGEGKVPIQTIPYGVPMPDRTARLSSPLRILYAGRFVEQQKRISDVTRALCRATREVPGTEAILYGSGPAEPDMARIIAGHGADTTVRLGGLVSKEELQEKFLDAHVFVLLSEYEGLPIALLEAMACGLVPICFHMRSGIPQLIEPDQTGLLVHDRDQAFVDAIRRLKSEQGLWARLARAARARVEAGYSIPQAVARWKQLFTDLIEGRSDLKRPIEVPHSLDLPPRHPDINPGEDARWPGYARHWFRHVRRRRSDGNSR
jgi:colanic acid/amylovoran biosynthesis glycosyltransferase